MVQIIEGTADFSTIDEDGCSCFNSEQEENSQSFIKPNITTMIRVLNAQLMLVIDMIRRNEIMFSNFARNQFSTNDVHGNLNRDSYPKFSSVDKNTNRYTFSRKIGTLYESVSLNDNELYHTKPEEHYGPGEKSFMLNDSANENNNRRSSFTGVSNQIPSPCGCDGDDYEQLLLVEQRLRYLTGTLLELRDATVRVAAAAPKSR